LHVRESRDPKSQTIETFSKIWPYIYIYVYLYIYIYQNPSKFGQHICEKHKFQNTLVRWT
jgi:hypothetical protein